MHRHQDMGFRSGFGSKSPTTSHSGPALAGSAVFGPEVVKEMSEAFDLAWGTMLALRHVCATDRLAAGTRRQLALAIVNAARRGLRDRARLCESALGCLFPLGLDGEAAGERPTSSTRGAEVNMRVIMG